MKTVDKFMYGLGVLIVSGFFLLLAILFFTKVPAENKDMVNLVVGALIGAFTTVVTYFYGSSRGSKDKDVLLANSTPTVSEIKQEQTSQPVQ